MPVSRLLKYYYEVQHPAYANKRYSDAMLDFVNEAMLAYECGYKESDLQATLTIALEEQLQSFPGTFKGAEDEGFLDECLHCIVLVWTTLIISPRSLKRWATEKAVSEDSFSAWRGFVSMIVHAYFEKRMAWYPIDRLSLELTAVFSKSESPHVVAERARIVFTTLERVFPQFPSL